MQAPLQDWEYGNKADNSTGIKSQVYIAVYIAHIATCTVCTKHNTQYSIVNKAPNYNCVLDCF